MAMRSVSCSGLSYSRPKACLNVANGTTSASDDGVLRYLGKRRDTRGTGDGSRFQKITHTVLLPGGGCAWCCTHLMVPSPEKVTVSPMPAAVVEAERHMRHAIDCRIAIVW